MATETVNYQAILSEQPSEVVNQLAAILPARLRILAPRVVLDSIGAAGLFRKYANDLEAAHTEGERKLILAEVADLYYAFHELTGAVDPLQLLNKIITITELSEQKVT